MGTLYRRGGDATRFEFEPGYWDDPARLVLGLWFENNPSESPRASLRLPAWFSNLLPEGRLREWIADDRGVSTAREMELLLRIGHDLPGAVTVSEADDRVWREPGHSSAAQAPDASRQPAAWRFSLAGIGMKFSMLQRADRLTVPAVDELGDWIVKSPDGAHPHVPINEFAMMRLASRVGIDVPQIRLVDRSELPPLPEIAWPNDEHVAFAIERFDRGPAGSRIHIEDFAQVRGFFADQKYEGAFDTVAALAYRGGQHLADLVEFTKRLTFNVLIGNGDAHLKNWSLLYADGRIPRLSPAYDLVSTGPYAPYPSEDMGLKLRGGTANSSASPCPISIASPLGSTPRMRLLGTWRTKPSSIRDRMGPPRFSSSGADPVRGYLDRSASPWNHHLTPSLTHPGAAGVRRAARVGSYTTRRRATMSDNHVYKILELTGSSPPTGPMRRSATRSPRRRRRSAIFSGSRCWRPAGTSRTARSPIGRSRSRSASPWRTDPGTPPGPPASPGMSG